MTQDTNSAGDTQTARAAPAMWAQRNPVIFITFKVESCKNPKVVFESNKLVFTGEDQNSKNKYYNELEVFEEIKPEGCVWAKKGPGVECTLQKKENGFWPRLLKNKTKMHWLKVDFNRWIDEDDIEPEEAPENDYDLSQMMAQMGGAGGMPGMPDMAGLGEDYDEEDDSDDEDLPDLEDAEANGDTSEDKA